MEKVAAQPFPWAPCHPFVVDRFFKRIVAIIREIVIMQETGFRKGKRYAKKPREHCRNNADAIVAKHMHMDHIGPRDAKRKCAPRPFGEGAVAIHMYPLCLVLAGFFLLSARKADDAPPALRGSFASGHGDVRGDGFLRRAGVPRAGGRRGG